MLPIVDPWAGVIRMDCLGCGRLFTVCFMRELVGRLVPRETKRHITMFLGVAL